MRKVITFPLNVIVFILALIWVVFIRVQERAIWLERKLDIFEENKGKKK